MAIKVHLEQLKQQDLHLSGELPEPVLDLQLGDKDALVLSAGPLQYRLDAQRADDALLVTGSLSMNFACDCARCLKPFTLPLQLPDWSCLLALKGPDAVSVENEHVDLTPWIREDILLGLPQHPMCGESCKGLVSQPETPPEPDEDGPSEAWSGLDEWKP